MHRFHCATLATVAAMGFASVASAADLPTKAPPPAPLPIAYNWTGFYIGGQIGGGWFSTQNTNLTSSNVNFPVGYVSNATTGSGFLGGGYAGFNYQINQFVIGIDGDYSWADLKGSSSDAGSPDTTWVQNHNANVKWIATLTGRLGYAVNNWLFFGKGGWAWAGFSGTTSTYHGAVFDNYATSSSTRNGWTVGAGAEWGFAPHWSAKLEYDYVGFSNTTFTGTATNQITGVVTYPMRSATSYLNIAKLGVAYRF